MNTIRYILKTGLAGILAAGIVAGLHGSALALRYFSQQPGMPASTVPYGGNDAAGRSAPTADGSIYYEVYGTGSPLVILHGDGLGCTYEMGAFIDRLQSSHTVIAVSTRGHGRSDIGHTPFSLEQRADDIHAVLRHAGITEKVTVLGFSGGGYSGYAFAAKYPDEIKKLATIGSGEVLPSNKSMRNTLEEWRSFDAQFVGQQQKLMPEPERWPEMLGMFDTFWNTTAISKDIFMKVRCPVLVMAGERDSHSPLMTTIAAYHELPDARLAIIPGAGHACFLENFDAAWAALAPFFNEK